MSRYHESLAKHVLSDSATFSPDEMVATISSNGSCPEMSSYGSLPDFSLVEEATSLELAQGGVVRQEDANLMAIIDFAAEQAGKSEVVDDASQLIEAIRKHVPAKSVVMNLESFQSIYGDDFITGGTNSIGGIGSATEGELTVYGSWIVPSGTAYGLAEDAGRITGIVEYCIPSSASQLVCVKELTMAVRSTSVAKAKVGPP